MSFKPTRRGFLALGATVTLSLASSSITAAPPADSKDLEQRLQAAMTKGVDFLKSKQNPDGGWHGEKEPPAVTALVLRSIVNARPQEADSEYINKGYQKLLTYQLDNGGIYRDMLANYNTAIAISALAAAEDPAFKERLDRAIAFQRGLQWTEQTKGPKGESSWLLTEQSHGPGADTSPNGSRRGSSRLTGAASALLYQTWPKNSSSGGVATGELAVKRKMSARL